MKKFLMVTVLFITPILAQCDWDNNGVINVSDIVNMVDCILNDCGTGDILGCTDPAATNYNQDATIDDCSCNIPGCTIPAATNYNPNATVNDCSCEYGANTCFDVDGNSYETVTIGNQEWMAENLKTTRYRNCDEIPTAWGYPEGAYAVYPFDWYLGNVESCEGDCAEVYGNLYNGYAVNDTRDICPEDWHVPTDAEWTVLTDYLGGESVAGGKMKTMGTIEDGTGLWNSPNLGATNESGFSGLPGGRCANQLNYVYMGLDGYFWSSTVYGGWGNWYRVLHHGIPDITRNYLINNEGYSVRCVRD